MDLSGSGTGKGPCTQLSRTETRYCPREVRRPRIPFGARAVPAVPGHEESIAVTQAPEHRPTEHTALRPPAAGVLVGVDLRGIQAYVYSGRRILDAVGRAALVAELTDTSDPVYGVADLVPEDCVVLRDAGGALTIVLPDLAEARHFTARYTRRLRDRAGDLTPVVAFVTYGPGAVPVAGAHPVPDVDTALAELPVRLRRARRHMSALHTPARSRSLRV